MQVMTREEFSRELGILGDEGDLSERGLAELLRSPLARWGLSPRAAVLRHARDQLEAAGIRNQTSPLVAEVLDRLICLGECDEVWIGHERYLAPTLPRWIPTGTATGALLGVGRIPQDVVELSSGSGRHDLVRRIRVQDDNDLAALHMAGVRQTSIEEWLRPYGYLRHAARRKNRVIRSDKLTLSQFWGLLDESLAESGLPLGNEAEVRVVTGESGAFFGRYDAARCEGRWSDVVPGGVWCAYRRGYGDAHWHPIIVTVDGDQRRALDLFDADEWRWAMLARGYSVGAAERIDRLEDRVQLHFPAPRQFAAAMDLLGPRIKPRSWSWKIDPDAPDPWVTL